MDGCCVADGYQMAMVKVTRMVMVLMLVIVLLLVVVVKAMMIMKKTFCCPVINNAGSVNTLTRVLEETIKYTTFIHAHTAHILINHFTSLKDFSKYKT